MVSQHSILPGKLINQFLSLKQHQGVISSIKKIQTRCGRSGLKSFLLTWKRISMWFVLHPISTPIGTHKTCGMVGGRRVSKRFPQSRPDGFRKWLHQDMSMLLINHSN